MSKCSNEKFTITKGVDNEFTFTVKRSASTLPIEIVPSDTFVAHLRKLSDGVVVLTTPLTVVDALSGKVRLFVSTAMTEQLEKKLGAPEDRYYARPVYSLVLECDTEANGAFLAKVPHVYID